MRVMRSGLAFLSVVLFLLPGKMISCLKIKKHESKQNFFTENGGVLLEELVAFCNGRSNPIRHFSAEELLVATNNYDRSRFFIQASSYQLYKGTLKDRPIFVKKYDIDGYPRDSFVCYKDIVIGSQMSAHKNVLKVLGCCLETQKPSIVYEFAGEKILSECIFATNGEPVLPWKCRLRIAVESANAIAYLQTAFSRPVIHRDIKSSNIMLDDNNVPKLTYFGLCISIPQGQSHVEDAVVGTCGYADPAYVATGYLTEKADVYSFGMLLLGLLCGKEPTEFMKGNFIPGTDEKQCVENFSKVVDPRISIEAEQLMVLASLVLRCTCDDGEKRPTMIQVAKELKRILQSY